MHRIAGFFGLQRDLPLGIKLLYLPELGLPASEPRREVGVPTEASGFKVAGLRLKRLLKEIRKVTKQENLTFVRLEFFTEFDEADTQAIVRTGHFLTKAGLKKSPEEMQPEYRQLIDLTLPEERLLAQMKPKGRYNIRVAERQRVVVLDTKADAKSLKTFHKLYAQAAERDGFTPRPLSYFDEMVTHMSSHMSTYVALWKGKPLAAAVIIFWQGRASYLYGGSSSAHRNVMAPYLLHWNIIQDAKAAGLKTYDLLAISPGGVDRHKFSGLRRFKEQFGGRSVRVLGSYDLIVDPLRYKLFVITEKLRGRF